MACKIDSVWFECANLVTVSNRLCSSSNIRGIPIDDLTLSNVIIGNPAGHLADYHRQHYGRNQWTRYKRTNPIRLQQTFVWNRILVTLNIRPTAISHLRATISTKQIVAICRWAFGCWFSAVSVSASTAKSKTKARSHWVRRAWTALRNHAVWRCLLFCFWFSTREITDWLLLIITSNSICCWGANKLKQFIICIALIDRWAIQEYIFLCYEQFYRIITRKICIISKN